MFNFDKKIGATQERTRSQVQGLVNCSHAKRKVKIYLALSKCMLSCYIMPSTCTQACQSGIFLILSHHNFLLCFEVLHNQTTASIVCHITHHQNQFWVKKTETPSLYQRGCNNDYVCLNELAWPHRSRAVFMYMPIGEITRIVSLNTRHNSWRFRLQLVKSLPSEATTQYCELPFVLSLCQNSRT